MVAFWVVEKTVVVCEAEVSTVVGCSEAEVVVENVDVSEYCEVYDVVD